MTIHQEQCVDGVTKLYPFKIDIQDGNCLAVFNNRYKDDKGQKWVQLYLFFNDEQHVRNILKNHESLFPDKVTNIKLNMYYRASKKLLTIFLKNGYKVTCFYKEPKKKSK